MVSATIAGSPAGYTPPVTPPVRPMRIVFISGEYPPDIGGVADYTRHLAHALADRGHDVSVVTSARAARDHRPGVRVHDVEGWGLSRAAADARLVRELRPDVINFQYVPQLYGRGGVAPGAAALAMLLRRSACARVVTTMHEIASPLSRNPRWLGPALAHRAQALLILSASHRAICTNPAQARFARRLTPGRPDVRQIPVGASIIPEPVTDAERAALRASVGGAHLIGEFSPLAVGKRPADLITLARSNGSGMRFLMMGGLAADAGQRTLFDRAAKLEGVTDNFVWTGPLLAADASRCLAALDVYVHTHRGGASGRSTTLASALAHGLPVVAYDGPETPDYLRHGGIRLASFGDVDALTYEIACLLESPAERARLAGEARALYDRKLAWSVIAQQAEEAMS
ncbi:MAG: glycosyltransferase family 4 protein [Chloroflexi bacterium]|nr:glycosyltransferase family 4 protein [Chloroflexota bacterium]